MAEAQNPIAMARMIAYMQNPVQGLQLQQQQALADQMMQEGSQQPDPNAMVGNHVVAFNPWGGLARAGERMAGAYETNQNNQKLAAMMQGGGGMGSAMNGAAPLTGNIMQDAMMANMNPEGYKQAVALKQAGPIKAAEESQTPVNMNGHMAFMTPPGMQNQPQQVPQGAPAMATPPQGNPNMTKPQQDAAISDVFGGGQQPGANPTPMSPQGNGGPVNLTPPNGQGVDFNNPVAVKAAEAESTKQGENLGDTEKTYNVVSAQLPRAIQRFQELRQAAPDASYGPGLAPADGGGLTTREQFANIFEPKTAKANQMIGQISSQGILPEIGPVIASTGGRGNQFMERMASSASGIRLADNPQVKAQAIDNVENQYVGNLKSQAAILRNAGRPALSDDQIDAMVAGYKAQNSIGNQLAGNGGGISWVRRQGKLVQQ